MGGELSGALSRLEGILVQSRAAIVPLLHPGIDQAEVVRLFAGVGLIPSAEVVTWYGWHDGAGAPGLPSVAIDLVPGGEFYDLGYLCGEYQQARSAAEYVASTTADLPSMTGLRVTADDLWRISWFPLLRLFGKGYVAVDLAHNEGSTSPVHIVWHDSDLEDGARVAWETVGSFVEAVIGRFEEGVYSVDDDGIVQGPTIDHPSRSR
jgi:cell wall assembly regulator SMI1